MMFCEMTKRPFERIQNNLHRFVYFEPVVFTIWIVSVVREHRLSSLRVGRNIKQRIALAKGQTEYVGLWYLHK